MARPRGREALSALYFLSFGRLPFVPFRGAVAWVMTLRVTLSRCGRCDATFQGRLARRAAESESGPSGAAIREGREGRQGDPLPRLLHPD